MNALIRLGCFALLMVGVGAFGQSKLPACPSSGYFHNCFGTAVNNSKKYVGEFQDGKRNGQGTYTDSTGSKYVGEFKDDKFSGQGTYANASGDKYVGEFQDYKFNGQGTFYSSNGSILYQGIWADDKFIRSAPFQQAS